MKPTQEQLDILREFKNHNVLKINACAGSGKSTTLRLLAEDNIYKSLYICFNKQNAVLASESFPSHVDCKTVHSLAYAVFGKFLSHKINTKDTYYINRGRTPKEIVNLYSIQDVWSSNKNHVVTSRVIASITKNVVEVYQNSSDEDISEKHLTPPMKKRLKFDTIKSKKFITKVTNEIIRCATLLWKDKVDYDSPVKADHDTYQKLYQLSKPKLDYDIIYLDEAQDSSPVVLDILKQQSGIKIVYVGDTFQSIYAFRQAVNAMDNVTGKTMQLSQSFRYGEAIADVANFIIDSNVKIKGFDKISSEVFNSVLSNINEKYTMLYRTNSALLSDAVDMIGRGIKVKCEIDPSKFKSLILSSEALFKGDLSKIKDDEISVYASWSDMIDDAEEYPEIKRLVGIITSNSTWRYVNALDSLIKGKKNSTLSRYDVLLTTAHKSKGMEWDNVIISSDFDIENIKSDSSTPVQQEVNLFYVACTRAIKKLALPYDFYTIYEEHINNQEEIKDE